MLYIVPFDFAVSQDLRLVWKSQASRDLKDISPKT